MRREEAGGSTTKRSPQLYFVLHETYAECCVEHTVGNTVRKLLHHIRDEYNNTTAGASSSSKPVYSIENFILLGQFRKPSNVLKSDAVMAVDNDPDDPDSFAKVVKPLLMEAIQDVLDELETVYDNISRSAKDHIHSEYVIELFLCLLLTIDVR